MSRLYRRIQCVFFSTSALSSRRSPLLSTRTSISSGLEPHTKKPGELAKFCVPELFNESDLRRMVDKFKLVSRDQLFRKRATVYQVMVRCLSLAKKFSWIEEILEDQKKYMQFSVDKGFITRIMLLYGTSGMFDHARKLFDEMPQLNYNHTLNSFNTLLEACVSSERLDNIEEIFREIPLQLSLIPDSISYTFLVKAYWKMGSLNSILSVVKEMEDKRLYIDSATYALLLDLLYQNGMDKKGRDVWELMQIKGIAPCIRCYNSKLRLLVSKRKLGRAVELFKGLKSIGLKPDYLTFCAFFKGFREESNLAEAKWWFNKLPSNGFRGCHPIFEILVPFAIEIGDFRFALLLCHAALRMHIFLDKVMLQGVVDGLVKESRVEDAEELLHSIQWSIALHNRKIWNLLLE